MIKKTQSKVFMVVMLSLTIIIISVISAINIVNYEESKQESYMLIENASGMLKQMTSFPSTPPADMKDKGEFDKQQRMLYWKTAQFYFVVVKDDTVIRTVNENSEKYTDEEINKYALSVSKKNKSHGSIGNLVYGIKNVKGNKMITFMDNSISNKSLRKTFLLSLIIGIVALLFAYFISKKISLWIVKPIEETLNKQKQFISDASHELKTPITSIQGFIETLKMTDNLDEDTKNRFLTIIENEATRLTRLIDDILLLSTIENKTKKKVEKVDLFEVFEEVHEVINYIAKKKNIKVKYDFENKDIDLWEYSGYIRQILLNIISNAIKYTGENGKVSIKQYIKSEKVFIEVKDNGIGIPEEDIERIFERFYRVDKARSRSVGGTGLGLAITKHMVKALNGNIRVESELGVGSKFIIELPFNQEFAQKAS